MDGDCLTLRTPDDVVCLHFPEWILASDNRLICMYYKFFDRYAYCCENGKFYFQELKRVSDIDSRKGYGGSWSIMDGRWKHR
ncbi:MAG: hypothetical protein R3Y50_07005 [Rikenellaceae bacterium]